MTLTVNQKGTRGLIKTIDALSNDIFPYHCFPAFDDHSPVDLIALCSKTGETFRIQVKYRSPMPSKNNSYEIDAHTVVNGKKVKVDKNLIDYWAVYLSDRDEVVFLPVDVFDNKNVHYIRQKHLLNEPYEFVKKTLES